MKDGVFEVCGFGETSVKRLQAPALGWQLSRDAAAYVRQRCSIGSFWVNRNPLPIGSMYAIYDNIYHQYTPNVSIYTSTMDPMGEGRGFVLQHV